MGRRADHWPYQRVQSYKWVSKTITFHYILFKLRRQRFFTSYQLLYKFLHCLIIIIMRCESEKKLCAKFIHCINFSKSFVASFCSVHHFDHFYFFTIASFSLSSYRVLQNLFDTDGYVVPVTDVVQAPLTTPQLLIWNIPSSLEKTINQALTTARKVWQNMQCCICISVVYVFTGCTGH